MFNLSLTLFHINICGKCGEISTFSHFLMLNVYIFNFTETLKIISLNFRQTEKEIHRLNMLNALFIFSICGHKLQMSDSDMCGYSAVQSLFCSFCAAGGLPVVHFLQPLFPMRSLTKPQHEKAAGLFVPSGPHRARH